MLDRWPVTLILVASLVSLAAMSAHADTVAAPPSQATPPPAEQLICHRVRETGTHISKKVCRTKVQLDADAAEGRQNMEAIDRNRRSPVGGDGSDMNSETPGSGA